MRPKSYEERIADAVADFRNQVYPSIRQAAEAHQVARTTLGNALTGKRNKLIRSRLNRMTQEEEVFVENCVLKQSAIGRPLTRKTLRDLVQDVLAQRGSGGAVGKNFVAKFLKKKGLDMQVAKPRERKNVSPVSHESLRRYFFDAAEFDDTFEFAPQNVYILDKARHSLGPNYHRIRDGYTDGKPRDDTVWHSVTQLESISGDGYVLPPCVVVRAKEDPQLEGPDAWYPKDRALTQGWDIQFFDNNVTKTALTFYWLREIFEPLSAQRACGQPRLLFLDGNHTYTSKEFLHYCVQHKIHVLVFPSHLFAPGDRNPFSQFKDNISAKASDCIARGVPLVPCDFMELVARARTEVFRPAAIANTFRSCGLAPFNKEKLLAHYNKTRPGMFGEMTVPLMMRNFYFSCNPADRPPPPISLYTELQEDKALLYNSDLDSLDEALAPHSDSHPGLVEFDGFSLIEAAAVGTPSAGEAVLMTSPALGFENGTVRREDYERDMKRLLNEILRLYSHCGFLQSTVISLTEEKKHSKEAFSKVFKMGHEVTASKLRGGLKRYNSEASRALQRRMDRDFQRSTFQNEGTRRGSNSVAFELILSQEAGPGESSEGPAKDHIQAEIERAEKKVDEMITCHDIMKIFAGYKEEKK
ncbi:hypothetical protein BABINDRAFT_159679 [Babjeviella inositovora NRRL Y-12698]|uniref:DDE-1 domain-containing protein n=1 Tax=Babjeviella inositovora NRRL Y-12698 TaxID=984486 RepID=A0A1E3R060_9ASCO|nr:uncharacterized protein BABINDRAFT_159679 [Babjeviella inositovora NRRL Y-12698]ODQ83245.1 hypothetical protein BABINDRAFT_159679 [Babjeviella inositovora NRRL Y-12698]